MISYKIITEYIKYKVPDSSHIFFGYGGEHQFQYYLSRLNRFDKSIFYIWDSKIMSVTTIKVTKEDINKYLRKKKIKYVCSL